MSPREALRCALAAVWAGADRIDAEAVTDQLADLGFVVVERPEVAPRKPQARPSCAVCGRWKRRDHRCPGPVRVVTPVASTRRLPKMVNP